jgi:porin
VTPGIATVARAAALCVPLLFAAAAAAWAEGWQELKADWAKQGVTPALLYQGAGAAIPHGGVRQGATYIGNLHLQLELDGGPLIGAPGLTVYADGLDIHGGQPSGFAGDIQGVSNIAGPPRFELYEAWAQYNFLDDRLSALVGQYDLNNEFYRLQSAALFLNGSFGIGPEFAFTGNGGPSIFPQTSVGARFAVRVAPSLLWRTAVLDGAPVRRPDGTTGIFKSGDGALLVSEINFLDVVGDGDG